MASPHTHTLTQKAKIFCWKENGARGHSSESAFNGFKKSGHGRPAIILKKICKKKEANQKNASFVRFKYVYMLHTYTKCAAVGNYAL